MSFFKPFIITLLGVLAVPLFAACAGDKAKPESESEKPDQVAEKTELATFAGGCFWCMEPPFEKLNGVKTVISGFSGGQEKNPSYKEVASGKTGHTEAVQVEFDPAKIKYSDLLKIYWRNIDPTDSDGQFVDRGSQYRPEIFVHSEEQEAAALKSKKELAESKRFKKPIVVDITDYSAFYRAEDYHQDYYKKSSLKYKYYRYRSGRDAFLDKHWSKEERIWKPDKANPEPQMAKYKKPSSQAIKAKLSDIQYKVTQNDATETPFKNKYWDNKEPGIYVDVVSGEPLFASIHKYKSGTGWPSFYKPLEPDHIVEKNDNSLFMARTEVRSKYGDSHLGHVFKDGPQPTGLRYCINSASLRFIPVEDLKKEGYGQYTSLFQNNSSEKIKKDLSGKNQKPSEENSESKTSEKS